MSLAGGHLDALLAAGATAEQIVALVKADMADRQIKLTARRQKDAVRQRRKRGHAESRGVTRTERDIGSNDRDILTSREEIPQEAKASLPQGAKTRAAVLWPCPLGVSPAHWRDFLANRKRKRCAQSQTALDGVTADIARIADDEWPPGELVRYAAAKGWASINDPRESKYGERSPSPGKPSGWEAAYRSNIG